MTTHVFVEKVVNAVNYQIEKDMQYIKECIETDSYINTGKLKALSGVHVAAIIKKFRDN